MTGQSALRARIEYLRGMQALRVAMAAQRKAQLDAIVEREQRRIDNLTAQLRMEAVR